MPGLGGWLEAIQRSLGLKDAELISPDAPESGSAPGSVPSPESAVDPARRPSTPSFPPRRNSRISLSFQIDGKPGVDPHPVSIDAALAFDDLFRVPPDALRSIFPADVRRGLLIGLTGVLEVVRRIRTQSLVGPEDLVRALRAHAARCWQAHASGIASLITPGNPAERTVRWLAWALDAPRPWRVRPRVLRARDVARAIEQLRSARETPVLVVWESDEPVPPTLAESVRASEAVLLVPEGLAVDPSIPVWTAVGGAWVSIAACDQSGGHTAFLPATGACVQALLAATLRGGWALVRPPLGAIELEVMSGVREARCGLERRSVGILRFAEGSSEFVVPPLFVPQGRDTAGGPQVIGRAVH